MHKVVITLAAAPNEMAQEEIGKQIAFLSRDIRGLRFAQGGLSIEFEAPEDQADRLAAQAKELAVRVQRTLRSLERKVVFRSAAIDRPVAGAASTPEGVTFEGEGLAVLEGAPLALFDYFDRVFREFGAAWKPRPMRVPTLIPTDVLAKCDYFRSFPHNVTYACHLPEDPARIEDFRKRHHDRETLDDRALSDMVPPEVCLSPAVCYHVYYANRARVVPPEGLVYAVCGKCFRYESKNLRDLRRLWDFTMREIVFLGTREQVLAEREKGIELFKGFLDEHRLAGEIRTASDPFFIAPDAAAKTYFQLSSDTKFEIALALHDDARLAVGSFNYHNDFFGKAFDSRLDGGGPMFSACIAFGLERWVYAFVAQHGSDPSRWPDVVRRAPELG
jgi:seryl-tRNA synthetase